MTDRHIPNERRQYVYKSVFTYTDNTTDDNDKIMENLHKQVIIDGVDVSGCEYCSRYADTTIYNCDWTGECKEHPNCHYKKWQRKEQECEELKKKCNIYTCGICGNKEDCNKFYKTLTEIKEIAEKYKNLNFGEQQYCYSEVLRKISEVENEN